MPLTAKGKKILKAMQRPKGKGGYGKEKGKEVFYASQNKGTINGVEKKAIATKDYPQGTFYYEPDVSDKAKALAQMFVHKQKDVPPILKGVYTASDARGRGLAKKLLKEVIDKHPNIVLRPGPFVRPSGEEHTLLTGGDVDEDHFTTEEKKKRTKRLIELYKSVGFKKDTARDKILVGGSKMNARRRKNHPLMSLDKKATTATIIKGNPKHISNNVLADKFYAAIEKVLAAKGVDVDYDPGEPHTVPSSGKDIWVGHSRGADRLRFAPKGVKTLRVDDYEPEGAYDKDGNPIDGHYQMTDELRKALIGLLSKEAEITLDIEKGDTLLFGRFKNSPKVVKEIGTDENGQPTVNGLKLLVCRIQKKMKKKASSEANLLEMAKKWSEREHLRIALREHLKDTMGAIDDDDALDKEMTDLSFISDAYRRSQVKKDLVSKRIAKFMETSKYPSLAAPVEKESQATDAPVTAPTVPVTAPTVPAAAPTVPTTAPIAKPTTAAPASGIDWNAWYKGITNAETAAEKDKWIRTKKPENAKGSTAYGPAQLTTDTLNDFYSRHADNFKGIAKPRIENFLAQGKMFSTYGSNPHSGFDGTKVEGYDPRYEYGAKGTFLPEDPARRAKAEQDYRNMVIAVGKGMYKDLSKGGKKITAEDVARRWRGKAMEDGYRKRFIMGHETAP